tara:strand:- start:331 stop:663 length:333 start_codon:yes stop_codon:yes gene_type:complete
LGKEKLLERARDELFSHINRCGVLQAEEDDQKHWMDETTGYIGERYPDLTDGDLKGLHEMGIRFCRPAIAHGPRSGARKQGDAPVDEEVPVLEEAALEEAPELDVAAVVG